MVGTVVGETEVDVVVVVVVLRHCPGAGML